MISTGDLQKYQHREHLLNENDVVSTTYVSVPPADSKISVSGGPDYVSVG